MYFINNDFNTEGQMNYEREDFKETLLKMLKSEKNKLLVKKVEN
jgi:ribosomal protein S24E